MSQVERVTFTTSISLNVCKHENGWYVYPKFGPFKRKYLSCADCGRLLPKSRWSLFL